MDKRGLIKISRGIVMAVFCFGLNVAMAQELQNLAEKSEVSKEGEMRGPIIKVEKEGGEIAEKEGKPEKKLAIREFTSDNKEYMVTVEYDDGMGMISGEGNAYYTVKKKSGEIMSKFIADVAPMCVYVLNNGTMIAFGGNNIDKVFYDKICFYNVKGELLKKHDVKISGIPIGALKISRDNKYLVFGYRCGYKGQLALYNILTGEKYWDISLECCPNEVGISNNGKWIIAIGELKTHWEKGKPAFSEQKIRLFDITGKSCYERVEKIDIREGGGGTLLFKGFDDEGTKFEIEEVKSKFNETKKKYERKISKIFSLKILKGKIIEKLTEPKDSNWEEEQ